MKVNGQGVRRARLSLEEIAAIADYGAKAAWPAGFQIYQRGAAADGVFIVLDGHIVLRIYARRGLGTLRPA